MLIRGKLLSSRFCNVHNTGRHHSATCCSDTYLLKCANEVARPDTWGCVNDAEWRDWWASCSAYCYGAFYSLLTFHQDGFSLPPLRDLMWALPPKCSAQTNLTVCMIYIPNSNAYNTSWGERCSFIVHYGFKGLQRVICIPGHPKCIALHETLVSVVVVWSTTIIFASTCERHHLVDIW